jgi:hypothetical protein
VFEFASSRKRKPTNSKCSSYEREGRERKRERERERKREKEREREEREEGGEERREEKKEENASKVNAPIVTGSKVKGCMFSVLLLIVP